LRVQGRPIGVLNFVSRTPGFYRDEDIPIAQQIADQVAGFIDNLHAQQQMRALIRHEAAERERARVGRDVYHVVAQNIPSIARVAEELERRIDGADPEATRQLARVRDLAHGTLSDVRRAIADLLPRDLAAMSLEDAARTALAVLGEGDPTPRLEVRGDTARISSAVRRAAYRIMQEAVTNVRHHSGARTLWVTIECARDLALTVSDNGVGFDPEQLDPAARTGLDHMLDRPRALGGTLAIESEPGAGTTVRFELLGVGDAADGLAPTSTNGADAAVSTGGSLRVFVIDRHPLMRAGLRHLAESVADFRVVGDAGGASEARALLRRLRPDVVLLDGHLAIGDLERLIGDLRDELPLTRVVITFESDTGHEAALADAGASRFLHKSSGVAELADAVRAAASAGDASQELPSVAGRGILSARERSILLLMTAGRTNTEIGQTLFLATKTVERQVATIVRKLGARNRAHAAAIAVSRQIVDPEQAG
jgi:DNA-binding NarL/FixJ family response regulator